MVKDRRKYKKSKAYSKFIKIFNRSVGLTKLFIKIEKSPELEYEHTNDLIRSAIVLSVSAMDAYFTDRFCDIIVPFLKKRGPNKDLIELLESAGLDVEEALIMASMKRPFRRIRNLLQEYLDTYVTQRFKVIDKLFLAVHLSDFSNNVQRRIKRKALLRSIELLVERRHSIAHQGDMNSHNKPRPLDVKRTYKQIANIGTFVEESDKFIFEAIENKNKRLK